MNNYIYIYIHRERESDTDIEAYRKPKTALPGAEGEAPFCSSISFAFLFNAASPT